MCVSLFVTAVSVCLAILLSFTLKTFSNCFLPLLPLIFCTRFSIITLSHDNSSYSNDEMVAKRRSKLNLSTYSSTFLLLQWMGFSVSIFGHLCAKLNFLLLAQGCSLCIVSGLAVWLNNFHQLQCISSVKIQKVKEVPESISSNSFWPLLVHQLLKRWSHLDSSHWFFFSFS